jgi:hypothetical protein
MAEAIRKALYSSVSYLSWSSWFSRATPAPRAEEPSRDEDQHRLGQYVADYSMPSQEEIDAIDHECAELFAHSKTISAKRET